MTKPKGCLQNLIRTFKSWSNGEAQERENLERLATQEHQHFSYDVLVAATKDFNQINKLGQGGFGPVYKGKLGDGRVIAVKKLSLTSNQGEKEFMVEAKLLARVQHRNVVNLLGYCVHGVDKLLVYEYVVNESLDKLLFKSNKRNVLDWSRRYGIICGIARGLVYLHEDAPVSIIHRDIKASNILLDDKWVPKIADFGMARLFSETDQTHVSTRKAGTSGYMAPEYAMYGHLSVKADVFSYGVLVLELISGEKNSTFNRDLDAQNLLEWAWKLYKKERTMEIVDPKLASPAIMEQITLCIHIGLLCVQAEPKLRPNMSRVVVMLSRKSSTMDKPTRPGYSSSGYKRTRKTGASSSTAKTGDSSSSNTFDSTATTSALTSPRPNTHGKRVMEDVRVESLCSERSNSYFL